MQSFEEIIKFAIEREKEAVTFYRELVGREEFSSMVKILEDFAAMEEGHVRLLTGVLDRGTAERLSTTAPQDLKLSDYLIEAPMTEQMSYQDILIVAIKREERAGTLYRRLAGQTKDADARDIFTRLANEEDGHKSRFEKLYDSDVLTEN